VNNFSAVGRIGRDAVTRFTQAGKAVTGWALAVDKGFGENKQTVWLDCSWWGERGTKVADFIKKGDRLAVVGEIGTRDHDGKTYVTLDIRDVTLLGEKTEGTTQRPARQAPPQNSPGQNLPPIDDFADDDIPF
jgi:single-strand DNA-binding protein